MDGLGRVVGHQQQADLLIAPYPHYLVLQFLAVAHIQPGQRFVHEQDFRFGDDGAGEGNPLFHPAAEFVRIGPGKIRQPNQFKGRVNLSSPFLPVGILAQFQRKLNILPRVPPRQQPGFLEHNRHIPEAVTVLPDVLSVYHYFARIEGYKPGGDAQYGSLSASRRTEDTDQFAPCHTEADA